MHLRNMVEIIERKRYQTEESTVLASDCYWDGHNYERRGRNRWLLKTKNGRYFMQIQTQWQGELDRITPLSEEEAICEYEALPEHEVEFEEAFPGVEIEEA